MYRNQDVIYEVEWHLVPTPSGGMILGPVIQNSEPISFAPPVAASATRQSCPALMSETPQASTVQRNATLIHQSTHSSSTDNATLPTTAVGVEYQHTEIVPASSLQAETQNGDGAPDNSDQQEDTENAGGISLDADLLPSGSYDAPVSSQSPQPIVGDDPPEEDTCSDSSGGVEL